MLLHGMLKEKFHDEGIFYKPLELSSAMLLGYWLFVF